jgi:hypothetical protein
MLCKAVCARCRITKVLKESFRIGLGSNRFTFLKKKTALFTHKPKTRNKTKTFLNTFLIFNNNKNKNDSENHNNINNIKYNLYLYVILWSS